MTLDEICATLNGTESWRTATAWQRAKFANEMMRKQYGWDALTQAWGWYLTGYKAGWDDQCDVVSACLV